MKSIKRLQLTQNAAARLIRRIKKRAHITPVLRGLHWLPVVKGCQFKILVFTYKSLKANQLDSLKKFCILSENVVFHD